ncbi:MAG TPA: peptidoglycan-binding domain-containing protein, partial [Phenylobacterium sp.]
NPSTTALAAPSGASPADISSAQQALSVLRYYQGPTDGVSSPALKMAIAAYQREAGLTATGALDPTTLSRLQVFTQ